MSNNLVRQTLKTGSSFFVGALMAIGTLCPIVLNSSRALAGYSYTSDIPTEAGNDIQALDKQNIHPTIAFTPTGEWVIIYNDNSAVGSKNFPGDAASEIQALEKGNILINTIAFTPKGEWVIIANNNVPIGSKNFPGDAASVLQTLQKQGSTIDCIAFTPNGEWVIIGNKGFNAYWSKNLPQDVSNEINTILQNYSIHGITYTIQRVVFAPNGGWGIIYNGGSNFTSSNIPQELSDTIKTELNLSEHPLNIAFTPKNGWVLEYGLVSYVPITPL